MGPPPAKALAGGELPAGGDPRVGGRQRQWAGLTQPAGGEDNARPFVER